MGTVGEIELKGGGLGGQSSSGIARERGKGTVARVVIV